MAGSDSRLDDAGKPDRELVKSKEKPNLVGS
jgi:hypothetical protein